jgi:hypothetical protein
MFDKLRRVIIRILRELWFGVKALGRGYVGACIALVGLVIYDHLTEISTKYVSYLYIVAGVVVVLGIWSRKKRWGPSLRKGVFQTIAWTFTAMGLIVLGISGEKQLEVFNGSGLSPYNFWVGVFLLLGILLPTPIFMLATWNDEAEDRIDEIAKRRRQRRVPTLFDVPGATFLDNGRWARLKRFLDID